MTFETLSVSVASKGKLDRSSCFVDNILCATLSLRLCKSCGCPPDSPAPSALTGCSAVFFAFLYFWEILHVNLFALSGGNCAQVVRRGCLRADARSACVTSRPHFDG